MFSKQHAAPLLELSNDVQDEADWVIGQLKEFELPTNFSTIAVDPTTKLLALGMLPAGSSIGYIPLT